VEQLGQGGMGVVYRAVEENLGREVALKIVAPYFAHDPEFRERFSREARAQASLESAHVVAVYAHGEEDGYVYIASQLIIDGDLGRLIKTAGVPPMVDALSVIEQVASGLADAHEAGLVHRDIKPGNVMVRIRGNAVRAYLGDFGIARRMDAASTRFGSSAVGTPLYMAPELHGGAEASFVTDVYSLGCLLWVALTGLPPYAGQSDYQIVAGHVNGAIPQLAGDSPLVNATNRILRLSMAKEASGRYPSAVAMRADLQAALRLPPTPGAAVPEPAGGTALRALPTGPGTGRGTHPRDPLSPASPPPSGPPPSAPPPSAPPGAPTYLAATDPPGGRRPPSPTKGARSRVKLGAAIAVAAVLAVTGGVIAAVAVDGGGSGGGGDDPTTDPTSAESEFLALAPEEILRASEKEMKVLDSVQVRGQFPGDDGKNVSVDMAITANGDCTGTMSFLGSGTAELLRAEGRVMVKPDARFLADFGIDNTQSFLDYLDGRWLEFTKDRDQFEEVCDLDEFLERDGRDGATATNEGVVTVQGQDAVEIHLAEGANRESYFVMVAEPHYLLRIDETEQAWFEYSRFDEMTAIELPAEEDILKDSAIGKEP
jgi:serine/threonine protein kinase